MIRPIRVAPFSQTRMISENPLAPNTMTNEQYLANQFASVGSAPPVGVPRQTAQPVSPVAGLAQLGEAGLEGSRNQQRTASKVSQKVGGLLGGGETASGLLGDVQGEAALQGLFATMQAIGRPVRRGEDRYGGAVQYGQQVMGQAQQRGLQDLSTRMQLEKFGLEKAAAERELAVKQQTKDLLAQRLGGATPSGAASSVELGEQYQRLPEDKKQDLRLSQVYQKLATDLASVNPDLSKQYYEQASNLYNKAFEGELKPAEYRIKSAEMGAKFKAGEYDERAAVVQAARDLTVLGQDDNPMDAIAAVFRLMKSLDPNSVVRDSEVRMATGAGGLFNQLKGMLAGAAGKSSISREVFESIRLTAIKLAEAAEMDYQKQVETQKAHAEKAQLDPSLAVWADSLGVTDLIEYRKGISLSEQDREAVSEYFISQTSGSK